MKYLLTEGISVPCMTCLGLYVIDELISRLILHHLPSNYTDVKDLGMMFVPECRRKIIYIYIYTFSVLDVFCGFTFSVKQGL